jgi:hypothetical protein
LRSRDNTCLSTRGRNSRTLITMLVGASCTVPATSLAGLPGPVTINDYGGVGLLETRTARFMEEGGASIGGSNIFPHRRFWGTFQPFPWLEATFRFTDITNDARGTDRSFDAKVRLLKEGEYWPQIAIGFQDLAGTGIFSSEYVVASRRFYNFDFTFGAAWGRLGSEGTFRNPLTHVSDSFEARSGGKSTGGTPGVKAYFSGREVGLFGGVEYATPVKGLRFLAEYDGDQYLRARSDPRFEKKTPVNFGVAYQPASWVDFSVAYERGDKVMVRGTLLANFKTAEPAPKFELLPEKVAPRQSLRTLEQLDCCRESQVAAPRAPRLDYRQAAYQLSDDGQQEVPAGDVDVDRLFDVLEHYGYRVEDFHFDGRAVTVKVSPLGLVWRAASVPLAARAVANSVTLPAKTVTLSVLTPEGGKFETTIRPMPSYRPEILVAEQQRYTSPKNLAPEVPVRPLLHSASFSKPLVLDGKLRQKVAERLITEMGRAGFVIDGVSVEPREVIVFLRNKKFFVRAQGLGRAARMITNRIPESIEIITLVSLERGLEVSRVSLLRKDVETAARLTQSVGEIWHSARVEGPDPAAPPPEFVPVGRYPDLDFTIQPKTRQSLFDPERPFLFQVYGAFGVKAQLTPGLSMRGEIGINIYQNFTDSKRPAGSSLPHVRSDIMRYLQDGKNGLSNLQVDYIRNLGQNWYGRVSAGYFEQMYGGFSGEVLYAPYGQRWAVGADLNQVWKRDFNQRLGFQDYEVLTGHLSINYEFPSPRVLATARAGRYLARDVGATFELTRIFESGVRLGGFFTLTDVSSAEFGEGSFDKGISLSLPLDLLLTNSSRRVSAMTLRPLFRDGGQMVNVSSGLYSAIGKYSRGSLDLGWNRFLD